MVVPLVVCLEEKTQLLSEGRGPQDCPLPRLNSRLLWETEVKTVPSRLCHLQLLPPEPAFTVTGPSANYKMFSFWLMQNKVWSLFLPHRASLWFYPGQLHGLALAQATMLPGSRWGDCHFPGAGSLLPQEAWH